MQGKRPAYRYIAFISGKYAPHKRLLQWAHDSPCARCAEPHFYQQVARRRNNPSKYLWNRAAKVMSRMLKSRSIAPCIVNALSLQQRIRNTVALSWRWHSNNEKRTATNGEVRRRLLQQYGYSLCFRRKLRQFDLAHFSVALFGIISWIASSTVEDVLDARGSSVFCTYSLTAISAILPYCISSSGLLASLAIMALGYQPASAGPFAAFERWLFAEKTFSPRHACSL